MGILSNEYTLFAAFWELCAQLKPIHWLSLCTCDQSLSYLSIFHADQNNFVTEKSLKIIYYISKAKTFAISIP